MKLLTILLLLLSQVFAAPAFNKLREFKQADGTTFQARAAGNHILNWIKTADGEILRYNPKSKNFEYAIIQNNTLQASGVRYDAKNPSMARAAARVQKIDKKALSELWSVKQKEFYGKKGLLGHQH